MGGYRLRALLATLEARCHAVLGRLPETRRAIAAADDALAADDPQTTPTWAQWFDAAEHHVTVGVCELIAARHDPTRAPRAVQMIQAGTAYRPTDRTRSRAFDQIALARAYVRAGELEAADQATATALDLFGHVTSHRVTDRVRELDHELAATAAAREAGESRGRIRAAIAPTSTGAGT